MELTDEQADKIIQFLRKKKELRGQPPIYPFKGVDPKIFVPFWDWIVVYGNGDPIKAAERHYEIHALKQGHTKEEHARLNELRKAWKNN